MTTLAVAPDGAVYVAGITQSLQWPKVVWSRFGKGGASDGFILWLDASGNVYVSGYTIDDRLPVTPSAPEARRKANTEAFALRMKFAVSK